MSLTHASAGRSIRICASLSRSVLPDEVRTRPGCYAATLRAPAPGDTEHADAAANAIGVIAAALKGYRLEGTELIHAIRMLRSAFHGIVSLEMGGGFGLPESVDDTYAHLVNALDTAFRTLGHHQPR
jgi:hypothetical protein